MRFATNVIAPAGYLLSGTYCPDALQEMSGAPETQ